MKQKILILGAGFGGVRVALDLANFGGSGMEMTLVDRDAYHTYTPDLYEVAGATLNESGKITRADFYRLEGTATVPLARIFHKHKNVRLIRGEAAKIDLQSRRVILSSNQELDYDKLILALGSEPAHFDIPGLHGRALNFKTIHDAMNIRDAICEVLARKPKHEAVRVTIVGGGFAGAELAAALNDFIHSESGTHARPKGSFKINIVEAGEEIIGGASKRARILARRRLERLGIGVMTGAAITEVLDDRTKFLLSGKVRELAHDVLIWTAGVCANRLTTELGLATASKGCLVVDEYLRIKGSDDVFAIGDVAYCQTPGESPPLPMTAQLAIHQGRYLAYTIRRQMYGRRYFSYFPVLSRLMIPLGGRYAVYDGPVFCFAGTLPWAMKRLVSLYYYLSILPIRRAWRLWRRSVKIYS